MTDTHPEHEDFPWTIAVLDHAPRKETPAYRASRTLMHKIVDTLDDWVLAPPPAADGTTPPYEDHHGGGVWVRDDDGWLFVLLPLGIEWSAQFCADPGKVDLLRQAAARLVRAFPMTLDGYQELGYTVAATLLATPVTDADGVAAWTDSIFNASVPIPRAAHSGTLPAGAGYHHYPKPIVDIDHFKRDDFHLFVDDGGFPAVVVPMSADPDDRRTRLIAAHPSAPHVQQLLAERRAFQAEDAARRRRALERSAPGGDELAAYDAAGPGVPARAPEPGQHTFQKEDPHHPTVLGADDDLSRQAFGG